MIRCIHSTKQPKQASCSAHYLSLQLVVTSLYTPSVLLTTPTRRYDRYCPRHRRRRVLRAAQLLREDLVLKVGHPRARHLRARVLRREARGRGGGVRPRQVPEQVQPDRRGGGHGPDHRRVPDRVAA